MSIKVKVERSKGIAREYPWIGEYTGTIVLFSGPEAGTILSNTDPDFRGRPGDYDDSWAGWAEDDYVEFTGTVTLSN